MRTVVAKKRGEERSLSAERGTYFDRGEKYAPRKE